MPLPSYYPLISGVGMFIMSMGMVYLRDHLVVATVASVIGFLVLLFSIYGWAMEGPGAGEYP